VKLICLETEIFVHLVRAVQDGFEMNNASIDAQCAAAVDHLACYQFLNARKVRQRRAEEGRGGQRRVQRRV
jgi:hypothetical protein